MEKPIALPFICVMSPVGVKMEMFVLAGKAWELRLGWSSLQGLCDRGQSRLFDGLLLLSAETLRSPGRVCQEQVVTQAATRAVLPPTATARRQHHLRQGEERWSLVYCKSVSEMPHVLKTLPSVQRRPFDNRPLLFLCTTEERWKASEVSSSGSRLQTTKGWRCDKV